VTTQQLRDIRTRWSKRTFESEDPCVSDIPRLLCFADEARMVIEWLVFLIEEMQPNQMDLEHQLDLRMAKQLLEEEA
jgi:hypothetical protein